MNRHCEEFHSLAGELIVCKPLEKEDAGSVYRFASDSDVSRYIGWKQMESIEETEEHV